MKLETLDFDKVAGDHDVSVRVGEAQKLTRLTQRRRFKFPASVVGNCKYGKVELYQRVGSCSLCVDPALAADAHKFEVVVDGRSLQFSAQVLAAEGRKDVDADMSMEKAAATSQEDQEQLDMLQEQQSAVKYINEHHLEVRLADAMQQVLRERPADPARCIADVLTKSSSLVSKLPKQPRQSLDVAGQQRQQQQQQQQQLPSTMAAHAKHDVAVPQCATRAKAGEVLQHASNESEAAQSRSYVKAHFSQDVSGSIGELCSKLEPPVRPTFMQPGPGAEQENCVSAAQSRSYDELVADLETLVVTASCGALFLHLSWHDARVAEGKFPASSGLPARALRALKPVSDKYCPDFISHADLWALAAEVALRF